MVLMIFFYFFFGEFVEWMHGSVLNSVNVLSFWNMNTLSGFIIEVLLIVAVLFFLCLIIYSASEHAFKAILTSLPKPGGGEFGKFYSLPALNDPRLGMLPRFSILYVWTYISEKREEYFELK